MGTEINGSDHKEVGRCCGDSLLHRAGPGAREEVTIASAPLRSLTVR